jgi:hypothetical protein
MFRSLTTHRSPCTRYQVRRFAVRRDRHVGRYDVDPDAELSLFRCRGDGMTEPTAEGIDVAAVAGSLDIACQRLRLLRKRVNALDPEKPKNFRRSLEHSGDRFVEIPVRCPPSVPPPNTAPQGPEQLRRGLFSLGCYVPATAYRPRSVIVSRRRDRPPAAATIFIPRRSCEAHAVRRSTCGNIEQTGPFDRVQLGARGQANRI